MVSATMPACGAVTNCLRDGDELPWPSAPAAAIQEVHDRTYVAVPMNRAGEPSQRRLVRSGAIEVAVIAVALVLYGFLRVKLEGSYADAARNARDVMRLERQILVDWEQDAQAWVLSRPFWITFWNWIYQWLYWVSVGTILVLLWLRDRPRYLLLRDTLLIAAAIGLVVWATFPVAPPRFMGYVDTLTLNGDRLMEEQPGMVNRYAAVPSFHVGWPAIAGFVLARGSRRLRVWICSMLPAVLLAFSVVFTGNHYVLDIVAGFVVVAAALLIADQLQSRRAERTAGAPTASAAP